MIVARLPLKDGYEAGLYIVGQDGKATLNKLKVNGTEKINDAQCYKCDLIPADDPNNISTIYVGTTDMQVYRSIFPIDGMPGAKMTMDLKK